LGHKQTIVQFFHAKDFKQHFVSHFSLKVFSIDVNISGKHQQQGVSLYQKQQLQDLVLQHAVWMNLLSGSVPIFLQ